MINYDDETDSFDKVGSDVPLMLVRSKYNGGFAYGNNVGMKYILRGSGADYFWCLNNDTVIDSDSMKKYVDYAERNPKMGICGATVRYYYDPEHVQYTGVLGWRKFKNSVRGGYKKIDVRSFFSRKLKHVYGCSMLVRKQYISEVGLINEEYFMYGEETDWAFCGYGKFDVGCADFVNIWHKDGSSSSKIKYDLSSCRRTLYPAFMENGTIMALNHFPKWIPWTCIYKMGRPIMQGKYERVEYWWKVLKWYLKNRKKIG